MPPSRCQLTPRTAAALVLCAALAGPVARAPAAEPGPPLAAEWKRAQALWRPGDLYALSAGHAAWRALADRPDSAGTEEGRTARARLYAADVRYRRALTLIESEQPGAQDELRAGKRLAPMDPALYLPLARACRARFEDFPAIQYYRSFLSLLPHAPEAEAARTELRELETEHPEVLDTAPPLREPGLFGAAQRWEQDARRAPAALLGLGVALGLGLAALTRALLDRRLRQARSLRALVARHPELHPALAYLLGRLRHELLKHRVGAAQDLLAAPAGDVPLTAPQRAFLRTRLGDAAPGGGPALLDDWAAHLRGLRRTLGPEFDLGQTDPGFRAAERALRVLSRPGSFARQPATGFFARRQAAALRRAARTLRRFDAELATVLSQLSRTTIDRALLEEALRAVRGEATAGAVPLDELTLSLPHDEAPIVVEVYRTDLLLVLKNVLRNAIAAVGRGPVPRRVRLDVAVTLLPTGEEAVRLRVHDTSPEPLTTERLYAHEKDPGSRTRGLGLVTAALGLYSGAIAVEPGAPGFAKCVVVQLFRALDTDAAALETQESP